MIVKTWILKQGSIALVHRCMWIYICLKLIGED